ncbi:MAG: DUF4365 domain-containing protein [Nostocaceae cyanobacterium]|nr:DUF4365 domain-containing protein [Nostocaceae cyanobacterium]
MVGRQLRNRLVFKSKPTEIEVCLKRCAYWVSLRGQAESTNQTNVTVYVPRQNIFSVDALKTLIQRIAAGEAI